MNGAISGKKSITGTLDQAASMAGTLNQKQSVSGAVRPKGDDGFSPVVSVSDIEGGHKVTINDIDGEKSFDVKDGISAYHEWEGTVLKVTSASGTTSADLKGEKGNDGYTPVKGVDYFDGADGKDGYTPVKGVDYFDGADGKDGKDGQAGAEGSPGKDGVSVTHEWEGTVLKVTSASGTTEADLKGDKGDTGLTGPAPVKGVDYFDGANGKDGNDGYTPVKGVDYFTTEEIANVAAQAASLVTPASIGAAPDGFGLGTTGAYKPLSVFEDLNTLVYDGWYAVNFANTVTVDGLNFQLAVVEVRAYTTDYVYQKITPLGYSCVLHRSSYAGIWSGVEWENPPLAIGQGYCTTERYAGKPVYTMLLDFGTAADQKAIGIDLNIDAYQIIRYAGVLNGTPLPYHYTDTSQDAWMRVYAGSTVYNAALHIPAADAGLGGTYLQIWYCGR